MKYIFTISLLFLSFFGISQGNETCWLTSKTLQLPTIQDLGDTLSVANVSDWFYKNPVSSLDKELQKIINRGSKFFLIYQTKTFVTIGFLEDEGEYVAVYAYSISKEDCKIISKEILAEETAWENGFTSTYTLFQLGYMPSRISYKGSKSYQFYRNWQTSKTSEELLLKKDGNWQIGTKQEHVSYQPKNHLVVWAISGLNMRAAPNLSSKKITTIPYGEQVKIIEKDTLSPMLKIGLQPEISFDKNKIPAIQIKGNWSKIAYKNEVGYVFDGFLSKLPALKISVDTLKNKVKRPIIKEKFHDWANRNFGKFESIPDERIIYTNGLSTSFQKSSDGRETTTAIPDISLEEVLLFYTVLLRTEYLNQDEEKSNDIWIIKKEDSFQFKFKNSPFDTLTLAQKGASVIVNEFNLLKSNN